MYITIVIYYCKSVFMHFIITGIQVFNVTYTYNIDMVILEFLTLFLLMKTNTRFNLFRLLF